MINDTQSPAAINEYIGNITPQVNHEVGMQYVCRIPSLRYHTLHSTSTSCAHHRDTLSNYIDGVDTHAEYPELYNMVPGSTCKNNLELLV